MAFIRAACILATALVAALFAVENMHEVAVGIFPVGSTVSLPVYLIVLAPLAVGLIAGWAFAQNCGRQGAKPPPAPGNDADGRRESKGDGQRNRK